MLGVKEKNSPMETKERLHFNLEKLGIYGIKWRGVCNFMYRFPIKLETEAKGCYNMINWKIGEVFLKDYCLKISCVENVEFLMQDKNEKTTV